MIDDKKRKRALQTRGVLIPPAFGVIPNKYQSAPISVSGCRLAHITPFYLDYLRQTDPSHAILHHYMTPGIWITAQAPPLVQVPASIAPSKNTLVHASLFPAKDVFLGTIQASRVTDSYRINVLAGTQDTMAVQSFISFKDVLHFASHINANGTGWMGAAWHQSFQLPSNSSNTSKTARGEVKPSINSNSNYYYRNDPFKEQQDLQTNEPLDMQFKLGTWAPIPEVKAAVSKLRSPSCINSYASMEFLGTVAAIQAKIPLDNSYRPVETDTFLSINLADQGSPPFCLTLERRQNNKFAAMSITQVIDFTRNHFNVLETRAPYIRNRAAWTVRLETSDHHDDRDVTKKTSLSIGGAWQLNRGLALKAVLLPSRQLVQSAVLLKRWRRPRVTCNLLYNFNWKTNQSNFGVGVELETETSSMNSDEHLYYEGPTFRNGLDGGARVPETKAALPDDN